MTDFVQASAALHKMFQDEWIIPNPMGAGNIARTPFCFDDEKFDPPDAPWAKFVVQHSNARQETLGACGGRKFSRLGRAIVMLRKPPLIGGRGAMDQLIKPAMALFEGRRLLGTTAWFKNVVPNEIGQPRDGRWYEATVTADFEYSETK